MITRSLRSLCFLILLQPLLANAGNKPVNIILIIVDGMGLAQISIAEYLDKPPSPLQQMEFVGLQKTYSANFLETDSGAAATAIACGVKTFNSAIGVDINSDPVTSIMELAMSAGYKTGFVVTSSVVHATPAAFYAHVPSRGSYEEIALQLVNSGLDIFIGGGEKYFVKRNIDDNDLLVNLRKSGYDIFRFEDNVQKINLSRADRDKVACFTSFEDPARASNGRTYLADMALEAKKFLHRQADKGFFLLIEASQVDWAAHANDQEWLAFEMQDAYRMIERIQENIGEDEETLLIVTSDHETGYISLKGKRSPRVEFNSRVHSSQMVPVFANGPGAEQFSGIYENTALFDKMKAVIFQD